MNKSTIFWMSSALFLLGLVLGFLLSPIKKGIYFNNNNRNNGSGNTPNIFSNVENLPLNKTHKINKAKENKI